MRPRNKINPFFNTHIHADHISGGRTLSQKTGAKIYMHESADVEDDYFQSRKKV
jgi:glyoxylase-like metal-dependent hydrolase (beta-lactamase superfamily II)